MWDGIVCLSDKPVESESVRAPVCLCLPLRAQSRVLACVSDLFLSRCLLPTCVNPKSKLLRLLNSAKGAESRHVNRPCPYITNKMPLKYLLMVAGQYAESFILQKTSGKKRWFLGLFVYFYNSSAGKMWKKSLVLHAIIEPYWIVIELCHQQGQYATVSLNRLYGMWHISNMS